MKDINRRKGFTLMELLGVVVILGIIALIAVPRIIKVIEIGKKSTAIDSAYGYIKTIDDKNKLAKLSFRYESIEDGEYDVIDLENAIDIKGVRPLYGEITINNGSVKKAELCINGYIVNYSDNEATTDGTKCYETKDLVNATINTTVDTETSKITINYTVTNQTKIKTITCDYRKIGEETYKTSNLTLVDNRSDDKKTSIGTCTISKLKENEQYEYRIKVTEATGKMPTQKKEIVTTEEDPV